MRFSLRLLSVIVAVGIPVGTLAQMPTYGLGKAPTDQEIQEWNNDVGIEGRELPPGSGSAKEGAKIFAEKCSTCHGNKGEGPARGTVAIFGQGALKPSDVNPNKTIANYYAFATSLFDYINRAMPLGNEKSLKANEVYSLTALLLYWNGLLKEDEALDAKTLPKIRMPNRDVFIPAWPPKYKPGENRQYGLYP